MLMETCLAMAIYFEARSEPIAGQLAVAQVVLNRVVDERHPDNICDVVLEGPVYPSGHPVKHRCQFSFWCDGKPERITDHEAWQTAMLMATVLTDPDCLHIDITEGATFYHATNVSPRWRYTMRMTTQVGNHIFYTPDNVSVTLTREME